MKDKLIQAFTNLVDSVITAVPKVAVGILLVVAALLIAKLIEKTLRYSLAKVRFDAIVGKVGVDRALQRLGIRQELTVLIPRLTYFLVLLLLAKTAVDALGLIAISSAIGTFFGYLPNIVAALLLLILGSAVGQFAGETVSRSAETSGIDFAPALGKLVSGLIVFVCAMMAISQLKIDTEIVRIVTSFILGGAALGFGLSFGLGTREIVRNVAAGFYARKILVVGKPLEVAGQRGVLRAITATHVILDADGQETTVSNATVLDQIAKQ
ncbi:MAG: mechanosensitive ion channel family protein [Bryobacteraceae bacterium]